MSTRSAVPPHGLRMQFIYVPALLVTLIVGALAFTACDDGPNRAEQTSTALGSLAPNASEQDARNAIEAEIDDENDARRIGNSVAGARGRGVSYTEMSIAMDELESAGTSEVTRTLNRLGTSAANPSGTATATGTADPSGTQAPGGDEFEEFKVQILTTLDQLALDNEDLSEEISQLRKSIDEAQRLADLTRLWNEIEDLRKQVANAPGKPSTPSSGRTPVPGNNGGETFTTTCGTFTWGPAGPAPGADTDDSPTQVREAIAAMQVPSQSQQYVTIHKACPGDDTPNGWIIGSSYTESQGIRVSAEFLPAGVCVDYDPNVTDLEGEIEHTQKFHDRWVRSYLISDGRIETLKTTVYWTPCVFTDGYKVKTTSVSTSARMTSDSNAGFSCTNLPTTKGDLIEVFPNTSASSWAQHPDYKHGWIYNGPDVTLNWVEGVHHFDYDGGSTKEGETPPAGSAFTVWFCK